ncbi:MULTISPECIES: transposase domain-containing protein, partial [unclassified Shigella]
MSGNIGANPDSLRNPLTSLGDYLDPELISRCLAESGTVTLRK